MADQHAPPNTTTNNDILDLPSKDNNISKRELSLTKKEDLLICKAFILTSEDPILGTLQKGKQFQDAMSTTYHKLIKIQFEEESQHYNKLPEKSKAFYPALVPYQEQSTKSLFTRFKKILTIVMKFMGIESATSMKSGQNTEDYYEACKTIFKQRYPSLGKFLEYCSCKEYFEVKPKWLAYSKLMTDNDNKHANSTPTSAGRPIGNKKAKKVADDKKYH